VSRLAAEVHYAHTVNGSHAKPSYGFLFSIFNIAFTLGDMLGPGLAAVLQARFGVLVTAGVASTLAMGVMPLAYYGERLTREEYGSQADEDALPLTQFEGGEMEGRGGRSTRAGQELQEQHNKQQV
jgi:hypothetical protein